MVTDDEIREAVSALRDPEHDAEDVLNVIGEVRALIERELQEERYNYEGAMEDLNSVVIAFAKRCKAEADWKSAIPYIVANYPRQARLVFGLSVAKQATGEE